MQVGIDSYSYHRRYGETRPGETPWGDPWPREPSPVVEHARSLDVDVLWVDGTTVESPDLVVPHPRMWERRFVLAPLRDLAPDLVSDEAVAATVGEVRRLGPLDTL